MIVLDTDVVTEVMRPRPDERVVGWLDTLDASAVALTAVTVAEIAYGVSRLPDDRKKARLRQRVVEMFGEEFENRLLPFDALAAMDYAAIVVARERAGRPISMADAQIASICRVHEAALATRNVGDFEGAGLKLLNPWASAAT